VCGSLIINGSIRARGGDPLGSGTAFGTEFTIRQTSDIPPVQACQENLQYWRCRNSLSMVLSPMPNIWDGDTEPVPGVCVGDCADWNAENAATTTSTPTTTSPTSSTSSTDEASSEPTDVQHCHSAEDCIVSGSWCDTDASVCVSGSDDPSGSSSGSSSDSSSEDKTHCHNDNECRGSQICDVDAFECVDSSSDSSSDSSKDSGDGSDSSEDLSAVALRYQRCAARVKELEAWQETLLSMTAAKHIQGDKDEGQGVVGESQSVSDGVGIDVSAYAKEAVIGCLVLMNGVLFAYACLCKSNTAKNKPVYGGVRCSEEEENLRV